jgi:arsenate reductase
LNIELHPRGPFFALLVRGVECVIRPIRQIHFPIPWSPRMANEQRPFNVLFLCTGNSARSIIAESVLRQVGAGRFISHSAGSHPTGTVNPFALEFLRTNRLPTDGMRSKNWEEFAQPGSPPLDFVFTVCDNAAGEVCPVWPGQPMTAHWGVPDPAAAEGSDEQKCKAFSVTGNILLNRIRLFVSLPLAKLDRLTLAKKLSDIGKTAASNDAAA